VLNRPEKSQKKPNRAIFRAIGDDSAARAADSEVLFSFCLPRWRFGPDLATRYNTLVSILPGVTGKSHLEGATPMHSNFFPRTNEKTPQGVSV
jgi:hypothetical protein